MQKNYWPKIRANFSDYSLIFVSLLSLFGAIIYYIYALNWIGTILALALALIAFRFADSFLIKALPGKENVVGLKEFLSSSFQALKNNYFLLATYILCALASIIYLITKQSGRSLISPWQMVEAGWFWLYAIASAILIFVLIKKSIPRGLKIAFLSIHYFISFSVALIIYKIGFGFDPFIHQATMELIDAKGLVLPKPPYYIGEYSLIIIIHKISRISIYFLNKFLVPVLAAIFLPLALGHFMSYTGTDDPNGATPKAKQSSSILLTALFLLSLTYSPFTLTTPQNLSYLFLILTVLASFGRFNLLGLALLALTTTAIHPLTGLPALCWIMWLAHKQFENKFKPLPQKILKIVIWLSTAFCLPAALFLTSGSRLDEIKISWSFLWKPLKELIDSPGTAGREDWLLNFTYFLANNLSILIIALLAASIFWYYRWHRRRQNRDESRLTGLIYLVSALTLAYFLSNLLHFEDLISYEQTGYASRIPVIILIFLLPFAIFSLRVFIKRIRKENGLVRIIWLTFGLSILTASLYLSYPRFDKYWNSRGYSTSANDIAAVKSIARQTTAPYIVLANQQVSAAALKELGFNHYFPTSSGLIFFYPIPTGGPLYQYYLQMVYKSPDRQSMIGALDLAGVNEGYLVINKYWYQSGKIINQAKLAADSWWPINDDVYIFRYDR